MAILSQMIDEYVATIDLEDRASQPARAIAATLDTVSDAAQNAATGARRLSQAMQETGDVAGKVDPAFERIANRVDKVTQAQRGLTRAAEALQAAQSAASREGDSSAAGQERQARTLAELARRVEDWASKLGAARADADALDASTAALNGTLSQGHAAFSQHIADLVASGQATQANRVAVEQAGQAERERVTQIQRLSGALDGYVQANDPVAASLAKVIRAEDELAQLRALGINATTQQASTVAGLRQQHDALVASSGRVGNSFGLQRYQVTNLTAQFVDLGVQLSSGGGLLLPLIQQSPQAVDAVGGLRSAVGLLAQVFTPARIAIGATVAAIGVLSLAYNSQESALATMQTRLRGVTSDYQAMGREAEAAAKATALAVPGLSVADARTAQISFRAAAPRGSNYDLAALTAQAADFAAVTGTDATTAIARFAQAMRDPVALVDDLARQKFPGMTEALRLTTQRLVEAGQGGDAFALVIGRVNQQTQNAARDGMSPLGRAVDDLKKELNALWQDMGAGLAGPAQAFVTFLTRAAREAAGYRMQLDLIDDRNSEIARNGTDDGRVYGGPAAAGQIPLVPSISNLATLPEAIRAAITSASQKTGVDSDILARIYARGEQSRQNADGSWPVSPKGAAGPFQFLPATFAEVAGKNGITGTANDPNAAALAAAYYFKTNFERFGDVGLALGAYNAGPGRIDNVLAGKQELPDETSAYIRRTSAGYNGTPLTITASSVALSSDQTVQVPGSGSPSTAASGTPALSDAALERALRLARGADAASSPLATRETQAKSIGSALAEIDLGKGLASGDAAVMDLLEAGARRLRGELEALKGPHADFVEEQLRAVRAGEQLDPVQRAVNETVERYTESLQRQGLTPSTGQLEEVRSLKLRELQAAYTAATTEVDRQTESQRRIGAAYAEGEQAVARVMAAEKAHELVRTSGIQGADARRIAEEGLTVALLAQQRVANDNAALANNATAEANLTLLTRERDLIGSTTETRERELAAMKARSDLERRPGGTSEDVIQQAQNLARQTVDATAKTTQLKNSWAAIPGFVEETAGTIKNALVSAIAAGEAKAVSFGNVWRAVKASAIASLIELGAINPVLNTVFGGTRGTLGGIGSVLGGSSGTTAPGATTSPLDLASSAGKLFKGSGAGGVKTGFAYLDSGLNSSAYSGMTGANVSYANAGMGALGVAGGAYGIYSGIQTGGARGWAQGIGSAASIAGGAATLLGYGSAATGLATAATATAGVAAAGLGAGAAGATAVGGAAAATGLGAAGGAIAAIGAVAPYVAVIALIAAYFLSAQKPSDRTGVSRVNLATGETSEGGLDGVRYSQENRDSATKISQQVSSLAGSLRTALGVDTTPFNFEIAVGARDGVNALYNGQEHNYATDEAGTTALISDITQALVASMKGLASSDVQSIIGASGSNNETLLNNVEWYNTTYKGMIAQSETPITAFTQQINALTAPIDAAIEKAKSLGISEDKLAVVRAKGVAALVEQRGEELQASLASDTARQRAVSGMNSVSLQILGFGEAAASEITALAASLKAMDLTDEEAAPLIASRRQAQGSELANLTRQLSVARTASNSGYTDRLAAADGSSATLNGQLASYDRKAAAERLAVAGDDITDIATMEQTLAAERLRIITDFASQAAETERQLAVARTGSTNALLDRLASADGSGASLDGRLASFERQSNAEMLAARQDGVTDMVLLERTLGAERLKIVQDYATQAAEIERQAQESAQNTVMGVVTSLTDYTRSLSYGDTSPLSARAQYDLATSSLNAVGGAAQAGDWNSISAVQSRAGDFLTASRTLNGSGAQYAADVAKVTALINSIAGLGVDRLTESARTALALKEQTQELGDLLRELIRVTSTAQRNLQQSNSTPGRVAA